ncbi:Transposable element Tc1 transposase [Dictyocoela muelleri]|nr:Transposable element Tc1 transposase [Dictyocoela muelleri]
MELSKNYMVMHEEDIKTIIFSDESKFNLFYSDGKVSVWGEPGKGLELKNLSPTVKHGCESIMVWGCFPYYGMRETSSNRWKNGCSQIYKHSWPKLKGFC